MADYEKSLLPGAASYGKTVLADHKYIGNIWCYCMDRSATPNAMISYCIFEPDYWNRGIDAKALGLFLAELRQKFSLKSLGAFTFSSNLPSIRVLEKNGFQLMEAFEEDGAASNYFQYECP